MVSLSDNSHPDLVRDVFHFLSGYECFSETIASGTASSIASMGKRSLRGNHGRLGCDASVRRPPWTLRAWKDGGPGRKLYSAVLRSGSVWKPWPRHGFGVWFNVGVDVAVLALFAVYLCLALIARKAFCKSSVRAGSRAISIDARLNHDGQLPYLRARVREWRSAAQCFDRRTRR